MNKDRTMKKLKIDSFTFPATTLIAAGLAATVIAPATETADARESTRNFSCSAVQNLVDRQGAIVLNTKKSRVYRRFVRDRTFCALVENTRRITVPTRDGGCRLRVCYEPLERSGFGR